ncbi:MAG: TraB/GumN family protein [Gammaproteobacteria bacterium]
MIKRVGLFLVLIFPLLANAGQFSKGLLWEVTSQSGQVSHVLGTMHSDDPRITSLALPVQQAFDNAKSFTGEVMMDMTTIMSMSQMMYYTDGTQLKDVIGDDRFQKCTELLVQYGVPDFMVGMMKPWAVATTISLPKPQTGQFLDLKLFQQAMAAGKPVYGLESAHEQMSVMDDMPESEQIAMLDEAIENFDNLPGIFQRFVDAYLSRDLNQLVNLNEEFMKESDPAVAKRFEKNLLVKRNHLMADRMQPRLKEGNAFIAIGALHLPGNEGVLNLLARKGYRVKAVY